ncbi:MAG: VWA domain-containing protein [Chloroflexi bacterium]|nr:VWA domain-containing protein [Chloroflexota bacterium]
MQDGTPTRSDAATIEDGQPYLPSELETVARLLLQDQRIRVVPGTWWSYYPERAEVAYPINLLEAWPGRRSIGALCHEIAEVLYSGPDAIPVVEQFVNWAAGRACDRRTAELLLNAINDLRVNQRYLQAFPGSRSYFQSLYRATTLRPKDDVSQQGYRSSALPHHAYIDALTARWAAELTRTTIDRVNDDRVQRALERTWSAIRRAMESSSITDVAQIIRDDIFPTYLQLVQASLEEMRKAAEEPPDLGDAQPPPEDEEASEGDVADDHATDNLSDLIRSNPADDSPAESLIVLVDESAPKEDDDQPKSAAPPAPAASDSLHRLPSERWSGGISLKFRRLGRRTRSTPTYEDFSYVEAVRRLRPQIDAILNGSGDRDGLIAILNRRRFGTLDPWRRPRRRRRGDTGDIDADHPENLVIDPSIAFLKGQHQARDDSQKDFAHAILLDVSGSVVQRGYRSRKFDQLIDTMVVFCEIHRRLKIPFELIAFSEDYRVVYGFDDCRYQDSHIDPSSAYVVRDLSYVILEMYEADHGETHETPALDRATADLMAHRGLKTIFVVTDGISSERPTLTERLVEIEQRNQVVPTNEGLMVLAFGLGLAEEEFNRSYQPDVDGAQVRSSRGTLVRTVEALPTIVCDAVDWRIRTA